MGSNPSRAAFHQECTTGVMVHVKGVVQLAWNVCAVARLYLQVPFPVFIMLHTGDFDIRLGDILCAFMHQECTSGN